jgi:hypothetical protein
MSVLKSTPPIAAEPLPSASRKQQRTLVGMAPAQVHPDTRGEQLVAAPAMLTAGRSTHYTGAEVSPSSRPFSAQSGRARAVPSKKLPVPATIGTGSSSRFPSGMPRLPGATSSLRIVTPASSKSDQGSMSPFAQTVAAGRTEALGAQIAEVLATAPVEPSTLTTTSAEVSTLEPMVVPDFDSTPIETVDVPEAPTPDDLRAAWLPSLVGRLRAPTRWQRKTWLGAWLVLTGALAVLVLKLPANGDRSTLRSKTEATSALAARPVEPTPPGPVDTARPVQALAAPTSAQPTPNANPIESALAERTLQDLQRRGLGFLTIHSTSPYASIYLGLRRYGRVDEKLLLRCGERFVAIGLPRRANGREPIWLAPGKMIDVPCGASLDVRMNPRRLRPRTPRHNNRQSLPTRAHR